MLAVAGGYRALGNKDSQAAQLTEATIRGDAEWNPSGGGNAPRGSGSLSPGETVCTGASCGGGEEGTCFVAGTSVATPSGDRPIETLQVGDLVLARGEFDDGVTARPISTTYVRPAPSLVDVHVTTADDARDRVRSTPEHLYFVLDRGWTAASELTAGLTLVDRAGHEVRVTHVVPIAQEALVYNFEVDIDHTYFVGHSGVWVHNTCGTGTGGTGTGTPSTPTPAPATGPVLGGMSPGATRPAPESIRAPANPQDLINAEKEAHAQLDKDQQKVNGDQRRLDGLPANANIPPAALPGKIAQAQANLDRSKAKLANSQADAAKASADAEAAHVYEAINRLPQTPPATPTNPPGAYWQANRPQTSKLGEQWGARFGNAGRPPANNPSGANIPDLPLRTRDTYREYRVDPGAGDSTAGGRRLVLDTSTGDLYYSRTHYGDHGDPAFVKIRDGWP